MFKPDIYVEHVNKIDFKSLKNAGIKLICFDVDNTLDLPDRETKIIEPEVNKVLERVEEMGFDILLFSNNNIENRVRSFATIRDYEYVAWARKPFQKNYKENEKIKKYTKEEVAFVGDKIVTDIIGGNIFGSKTILVDPLFPKSTKWYTYIMNTAENGFTKLVGFKRGSYYHE